MNTAAGTVAHTTTLRGGERLMALDLLDESPITRLTEDENPFFSGGVDFDPLDEPEVGVFPEAWDL